MLSSQEHISTLVQSNAGKAVSEAKNRARDVLAALYAEKPSFHGREDAGSRNFSIGQPVLNWLLDALPANPAALETGCGYTTVVLAALGARLTIVSPFTEEHALIKKWCYQHDLDCAKLDFIAKPSQEVFPLLPKD